MLAVADGPLECGPVAWHRSSFVPLARLSAVSSSSIAAARRAPGTRHPAVVRVGQWRPACVLWHVCSGQSREDLLLHSKLMDATRCKGNA